MDNTVYVAGCHNTHSNDTQHDDIDHNNTQHSNILYNDTQHNSPYKISVMLSTGNLLLCWVSLCWLLWRQGAVPLLLYIIYCFWLFFLFNSIFHLSIDIYRYIKGAPLGQPLSLLVNIRIGWKGLLVINQD